MPCRVPKRRFSCGAPQHLTKNLKKEPGTNPFREKYRTMQGASESEVPCFPGIRMLPSSFEWLCTIMAQYHIYVNIISIFL